MFCLFVIKTIALRKIKWKHIIVALKLIDFKRSIGIVIISMAIIVLCSQGFCQNLGSFYQYTQENGFPSSTVNSIFQDRLGLIWIGTNDGLVRYDGYNFKIYRHEISNPSSISDDWVVNIYLEDTDKNLWLLTADGVLCKFSPSNERFEYILKITSRPLVPQSSSTIYYITEDCLGNIWISTINGIYRYNKKNIPNHDLIESSNYKVEFFNYVSKVYTKEKTGKVWFGSNCGVFYYDLDSKLKELQFTEGDPNVEITNIIADTQYNICFTTRNSIYQIYLPKQLVRGHPINDDIEIQTGIYEDEQGEFIINEKNSIIKYSTKFDSHKIIRYQDSGKTNAPLFYKDRLNSIWISCQKGLYQFNSKTENISLYKYDKNISVEKCFFSLLENKTGDLWLLVTDITINNSFLFKIDPNNRKLVRIENGDSNYQFPEGYVDSYILDSNNNFWLGGYYLKKFIPFKKKFYHYTFTPELYNTSRGSSVWDFLELDEKILISPVLGLVEFDPKDESFKTSALFNQLSNYPSPSKIMIDNDNLLVSTFGNGLFKFNLKNGIVKHFPVSKDDEKGIPSNYIGKILKDTEGYIWISVYAGGIIRYDPFTGIFKRFKNENLNSNSLANDFVWNVLQDGDSNLWFNVNGSIDRYNPKTAEFKHFGSNSKDSTGIPVDKALYSFLDSKKNIWFGTVGGGLSKFDSTKQKFMTWSEKDGLPNSTVNAILEDEKGYLWLSTNNGLSRFNPRTYKFRNFNTSSGLVNIEFNAGACYKSSDGRLYFGGTRGFTAFYPEEIKDDTIPPRVIISGIKLFGKDVSILPSSLDSLYKAGDWAIKHKGSYFMHQNITYSNQIKLNHKDNYISIEFAALHFDAPEKNTFKYRMVGFDDDWIYSGNIRVATYNNLPHGDYKFEVLAANPDGYWSHESSSIKIVIIPPFWKTTFFIVLVVLSILLLGILYIRLRESNLRRAKEKLEMNVQERTKEIQSKTLELQAQNELINKQKEEIAIQAKQIRDELVAKNQASELSLLRSRINPHFLFNTLNNINTLVFIDQQKTYDAILKLSEIMRYMHKDENPEYVSIEKEVEYIENFIELQKLRFKDSNFVVFSKSISNPNVQVAPMIFIAFVENSFKHCNKKSPRPVIKIDIRSIDNTITLRVENYYNPKPKAEKLNREGGFGIENMKRRLELIYPEKHSLSITQDEGIYKVELKLERT
ncbi:MAG: GHKL domain-containing protein [Bacteroidales bacterium]|nr:MAG: GHKL domain-containing protein [Bacteroidales bacterium]